MSFANKVILITGASSGIGAECAVHFAKKGALLALVGRNADKFKIVLQKIKTNGVTNEPLVILADVSTDAARIIDETIKKYQRLDVLINNAGFAERGSIEDTQIDTYDSIMNTNLRGVVLLTQLAAPHLVKTKGNVVNISSIVAMLAIPNILAYSLSKAALDHFTRIVSMELAAKGIRVNSVNPGATLTDFFERYGMDDQAVNALIERCKTSVPLGRIGLPGDVTKAIDFFASDNASFVTGQCLAVDGGASLKIQQ